MVYVWMCAYNAEKTIIRAIESILNQTHQEFLFYILDNGSTDGTGGIIRRYAEKDERIVPFYGERNCDFQECGKFWSLFYDLQEEDYLCTLDADDGYEITFLEEMLHFSVKNELDIAMCGSVFVNADTQTSCGERVLQKDIVLTDKVAFENNFPVLYWNLRQIWGKLYSARAARLPYVTEVPEWYPKAYGGDTVNIFEIVKQFLRIGVLAKPLHHYTVSQSSVSRRWQEGREQSDILLFEKGEELLMKKCGRVSPENYRMLYAVYFNAVSDTFRVLSGADLPVERKVSIAKEIFFHPITQKMFTMQFDVSNEERIDFFVKLVVWLLSLWDEVKETDYTILEEIFTNINPDFPQLVTEEGFTWYMENHPVIMRNVVLREYEYAVNNLLVYLNKKEIQPTHDFPYILGQQLSALRNEEEKYVIFSKNFIRWCIEHNQRERAWEELKEWQEILPEDKDIKALQSFFDKGQ